MGALYVTLANQAREVLAEAARIGGISVIAPDQRTLLSELGMKALIAGTLACFMTACIVGMLV
jgi:CNT family concentrative nucleoside transporter